jgi:hypothetical protein
MKSSHYLAIAIRLFSIVVFIYFLRQSSYLIEVILNGTIDGMAASAIFVAATTIGPLLMAMLLWLFPVSVAKIILKPEVDLPVKPMAPASILSVLIVSIGVFAFYYAVTDALYWATMWNLSSQLNNSGAFVGIGPESKASMWATAFEFIFSLCLILRAKSASHMLIRFAQ